MPSDVLLAMAVTGGIVAFLAGLVYFIYWAQNKLEQSFHQAARLAKLRRLDASSQDGWKLKAAYDGAVDGAHIRFCLGSKIVSAGGNDVPLSGVILESEYPTPLPFDIEMRRNAGVVPHNYRHPDDTFQKRTAVQTTDPAGTDRLLDEQALRDALAQFLKEGQGCALVDQRAISTVLFDVRQAGPRGVVRKMRALASLSNRLAERARTL